LSATYEIIRHVAFGRKRGDLRVPDQEEAQQIRQLHPFTTYTLFYSDVFITAQGGLEN